MGLLHYSTAGEYGFWARLTYGGVFAGSVLRDLQKGQPRPEDQSRGLSGKITVIAAKGFTEKSFGI